MNTKAHWRHTKCLSSTPFQICDISDNFPLKLYYSSCPHIWYQCVKPNTSKASHIVYPIVINTTTQVDNIAKQVHVHAHQIYTLRKMKINTRLCRMWASKPKSHASWLTTTVVKCRWMTYTVQGEYDTDTIAMFQSTVSHCTQPTKFRPHN